MTPAWTFRELVAAVRRCARSADTKPTVSCSGPTKASAEVSVAPTSVDVTIAGRVNQATCGEPPFPRRRVGPGRVDCDVRRAGFCAVSVDARRVRRPSRRARPPYPPGPRRRRRCSAASRTPALVPRGHPSNASPGSARRELPFHWSVSYPGPVPPRVDSASIFDRFVRMETSTRYEPISSPRFGLGPARVCLQHGGRRRRPTRRRGRPGPGHRRRLGHQRRRSRWHGPGGRRGRVGQRWHNGRPDRGNGWFIGRRWHRGAGWDHGRRRQRRLQWR